MNLTSALFMFLSLLVPAWMLIVGSHLHQMMLLWDALSTIAWLMSTISHHWMETIMSLSCKTHWVHHHLRHHKTTTHEWIWEAEWIVLTWCLRSLAATSTAHLAMALRWCRRSTSTFNCLFFEFFFFLLLLVHNNVIRNIIDVESSISCPWLGNSLCCCIKAIDLWLLVKESILINLLWCLIIHLLIAFNRVKSLILRRWILIKYWLLVFFIIIHSLFLLLHHLFNFSFLVDDELLFTFGSLGVFLHLVMDF